MPEVNCEKCNEQYSVKPYRVNKTRFCDMECRAKVIFNTPETEFKKGHISHNKKDVSVI